MTDSFTTNLKTGAASALALAVSIGVAPASLAQVPPPAVVPAPAPEPSAPATPTALTTPPLTGPLTANPNPYSLDTVIGNIYVGAAVTGMGLFQSNPVPGNTTGHFDLTNGQLIVQKTDGVFQFYTQSGVYSFPTVGTPYFHVSKVTGNTFGGLAVGYAKLQPTEEVSVQVGKLPTLIGAEYAFTFQNMNIERGLLWNQEPIISRGVQGNYTSGPLTLSVSWNDGYYSNNYNWISGLASYTLNKENTIAVAAGGNFGQTSKGTFVTPVPQSNSRILNVIYTYNAEPWTITPYFQYTDVPTNAEIGVASAQTYGGAILANYKINDNVNVAGRAEYISTSGSGNLLYGPGSSAMSFTVTPTWQNGVFFVRAEASYVEAFSTTAGLVFGKSGNSRSQVRGVIEGGILF